ncbi:MAG: hypothetical protein LBF05_03645 [Tannerella sp.]|nr:hypothetical protein [Tannerella sp.]
MKFQNNEYAELFSLIESLRQPAARYGITYFSSKQSFFGILRPIHSGFRLGKILMPNHESLRVQGTILYSA